MDPDKDSSPEEDGQLEDRRTRYTPEEVLADQRIPSLASHRSTQESEAAETDADEDSFPNQMDGRDAYRRRKARLMASRENGYADDRRVKRKGRRHMPGKDSAYQPSPSEDGQTSDFSSISTGDEVELGYLASDYISSEDEETGLSQEDKRRRKRRRKRDTDLVARIGGSSPSAKLGQKIADRNVVKALALNSMLVVSWYLFSLSISIYNKWMFTPKYLGFHFPLFTTCMHMVVQFCLAALVLYWVPHLRPRRDSISNPHDPAHVRRDTSPSDKPLMTKMFYLTRIGPCGAATGLDIGLGNMSIKLISLTFYTMCKSSSLAFVLIFAFLFRLETPSIELVAIIVAMTVGVMMMVAGELSFDALGFVLVILAAFFSGFRWSLTQILLLRSPATSNPFSSIFFLAPVMFLSLAMIAIPVEGFVELGQGLGMLVETKGVFMGICILLFPGLLAFMMTASEFALLQRTSVVTLSICGIFKEVVTISAAGIAFHDPLTPINVSGLLVTIASIGAYNYIKITKMRREARMEVEGRHDDADVGVSQPMLAAPKQRRAWGGGVDAETEGLYGNSDAVDFDESWNILRSALREIHSKNASRLSFEELYRHAYKLVLKKKADLLYEKVKDFEQSWLAETVHPRIASTLTIDLLIPNSEGGTTIATVNEKKAEGEKLLRSLKEAWEDYNLCVNMITAVLMYMERVYCRDFRKPSILTTSMGQFRDFVLRTPLHSQQGHEYTIAHILNTVILDQIRMEREGDIIDRALLKSCVYMLEDLYETEDEDESAKLYLTSFEPEFLSASKDFYQKEGASLLLDADAGTFCRHARKRADEEEDRCRSTLSLLTSSKIRAVVETELIEKHLGEVIALENSGVGYMLDNDRLDELGMIYDLSARVDSEKRQLKEAVQSRVVRLGTEINKTVSNASSTDPPKEVIAPAEKADGDKADGEAKAPEKAINLQTMAAIKWVDDVLQLKGKYDNVLAAAFQGDQLLQAAITRSFSEFINGFERSPEYLSLFFDENMKKGIRGKTESEVDALLDQGIILLRYIQDKDMFERYYKKHLSRRLLMKRSISMDAERQMISKMKMTVGNTFTQRIENMFRDIGTSADLSSGYKEHVASLGDPDPKRAEIEVNVLTSTMWPLETMITPLHEGQSRSACIFPSQIERIKQGFEKYYLGRHNGRQLTWQASMGTADLKATFPECKGTKKTRDLNVSTYAMVILLLFNDIPANESITCEELQARTNIPMNDLARNLQSLSVAPKTRILRKEPMSKDIKPTDRFFFNESYYSPYNKVKINVVASGNRVEGAEERSETEKKNNDERQGVVDAALVRIMKQRKECTHVRLIQEVIQQLSTRFSPDVSMIKKRIESLIDREYLERMDSEPPAYRYLA
ncbi:MAG: hypothetical protein Q9163_003104 [Psora crenata]